MKLLRYGRSGEEKPGLLDADGAIRDLSAHIADLRPETITGTLPGVGEGQKPNPIFPKPGDEMHLGISKLGEQRQRVVEFRL